VACVGQRELPRPTRRVVVPGDADEGLAYLAICDLDRRPESGAFLRHKDERALDPPRPAARDPDEEIWTVAAERSAWRRTAIRRSAIGIRGNSERRQDAQ